MKRILGICGSLRSHSSNRALLEVAAMLVPSHVTLEIHEGFGEFPLFRPDATEEPEAVRTFRQALATADAVIIASPEYAHGVTGSLKNALDWVVASGEFSGKPVAIPNTSFSSHHAHAALMEILRTMDAQLIETASGRIPLPGSRITREEIASDPLLSGLIRETVERLLTAHS
ncbi:MAG: NADPH-dependent FMN reductase [Luteolibacter sp.]